MYIFKKYENKPISKTRNNELKVCKLYDITDNLKCYLFKIKTKYI